MTHVADLDGSWDLVRAHYAGEEAPELVVEKTVLVVAAGRYEVRFAGELTDEGMLEIGKLPDTLTLRGVEGANRGRTIPCLYQLRGDRLRVCYGLDGEMPAGFDASAGTQRYLAMYRRAPKR